MTRVIAVLAAAIAVAGVAGMWAAGFFGAPDEKRFASCTSGGVAGGSAQIGGPFELVNAQGETVTDADIITDPTLIYFGYTFCPDVCPLDAARNAEAVEILEERGQMITPVFISIDPARDTPEVVGEFASVLHDRMIGLTGSAEQVKAASQAYRTYYKAHPAEEGEEFYLVDHSTFSYLVLPEHGFVDYFTREVTPDEMADRVQCFIDNS